MKRRLALAAVLALALLPARPRACSISEDLVFTFETIPGTPLASFADGRLGVILPTWRQRYLAIAWRHLSAAPLSSEERASLLPPAAAPEPSRGSGMREWSAARRAALGSGAAEPRSLYLADFRWHQDPASSFSYTCVLEDAWRTAARTLEARVRARGAGAPEVLAWVTAQDRVFAMCTGDSTLPDPAPAGASAESRADRAYQVASALFYAERFAEAERAFRALALDPASPWRRYGRYLAARALLRRASFEVRDGALARALAGSAAATFDSVARDPGAGDLRASAAGLAARARRLLDPQGALDALAARIAHPLPNPSFAEDLADYARQLDHEELAPHDDLTDWIRSFQRGDGAHALQRWRAGGGLPWLVAALSSTPAGAALPESLRAAAETLPPASPAYATARWQLARHAAAGARDRIEAGRRVNAVLAAMPEAARGALATSDANRFRTLRLPFAASLEEFLREAAWPAAGIVTDGMESWGGGFGAEATRDAPDSTRLPDAAARALDSRMPLELLARAARDPRGLPAELRAELARSVWVRAVLLGRDSLARAIAVTVDSLDPALGSDLARFRAAGSAAERRTEALWIVLRHPGLTPWLAGANARRSAVGERDALRDNWWDARPAPTESSAPDAWPAPPPAWLDTEPGPGPLEWLDATCPAFLTAAERRVAAAELSRIAALGPAPDWLCGETLRWSLASPLDPRVPEALARCVEATHYGPSGPRTTSLSRRVFTRLKSAYPDSPWAKRTKYWY